MSLIPPCGKKESSLIWIYNPFKGPTQTASEAPLPVLALADPTSSTHSSFSDATLLMSKTLNSRPSQTTSTLPQSVSAEAPAAPQTHSSNLISTVQPLRDVEEEILSLPDALVGLSANLNHMAMSESETPVQCQLRKAKFYLVVVGRCCDVYSSWLVKF